MSDATRIWSMPTIHMNGTSPKDLLEDLTKASRAVREAIDAVAAAGPNGRDYYTQGPTAFNAARNAHQSRLERLDSVRKELEMIAEHVADYL